jgi:predicted NBD/HSP70 family sugar kinase
MRAAIGIDIGGTSVKVAAVGADGAVLWTGKSASFARPDTGQVVAAISEALAGRAVGAGEAVGVCCPGLLDRAAGMITLSVNVPGIVGVPLAEVVGRAVGRSGVGPLAILSDANAVGYDVYAGKGLAGRLLCLTLGTGVGASVVDEGGRFLHVSGESPGHFGQLDVSLEGEASPVGPDGGRGSLEAYIGTAALAGRYGDANVVGRLTVGEPPVAALVRAIRIGHAVYRPQHVCLTGGIGVRLAPIVAEIQAAVEEKLTRVARPGWTLFTGEDDFHAARGAARFARG